MTSQIIKLLQLPFTLISKVKTFLLRRKRKTHFRTPWDIKFENGIRLCWAPDLTSPDLSAAQLKVFNSLGIEIIDTKLHICYNKGDVLLSTRHFKGERIVLGASQVFFPALQKRPHAS